MKNMLENLLSLTTVLEEILKDQDVMIAITNREETLYFKPGITINHGNVGYKLTKGDGLYDAIEQRQTLTSIVPKEILGVPFKATTVPLFDEQNEVVGCIGLAWGLETQDKVISMANNIASFVTQITSSIFEVSSAAQQISTTQLEMISSAMETRENANNSAKLAEAIKQISNQIQIIGLNANIEAARSGEYGRGFSVIAKEVQNLASSSKNSVSQIEIGLKNMVNSVNIILSQFTTNSEFIESHVVVTEQMNSSISELKAVAEELLSLAQKL